MNNTYVGNALENAGNKAKYDAEVKKILSDKTILSWILKYTVAEFNDASIQTILSCIEGEPEVAVVPVEPGGKRPDAITGVQTEDSVPNEGKITYDIRFHVVTPTKELQDTTCYQRLWCVLEKQAKAGRIYHCIICLQHYFQKS